MSVNKFSALVAYFKNLTEDHVELKGFYRFELDEVLTSLRDIETPALILEGYKFSFSDQKSDNILKNRSGAFIIIDHVENPGDYDEVHSCWDACEELGDDILARMREDKRLPGSVVKNVKFDSIEGNLLATELGNYYGIRFTWDIESTFNQVVNTVKWKSKTL